MLVTKSYQLGLVKAWLERCNKDIAYDIETTGLNAFTDHIIGIGLSDSVSSYYLVLLAWNKADQCLENVLSLDEVLPILNMLKTKKLVTWNGSFDLSRTLRFLGLDLIDALYIDGMLLKHTINEESRSFALKETAIELFGASAGDAQAELFASIAANGGAEKEYYKADTEVLGKYCIKDCILTLQIKARYLPMLKAEGTHDFFFNEVMELYKTVTIPMEMHGVTLDMPLLEQSAREIAIDIETLEAEVQTAVAPSLEKFKTWF
jgi:DNA polymerase I-like protein with 3'-5' exonuclease and polymerase domains